MKSSLSSRYSSYLKTTLLLIQLVMGFGSPTVAQAGTALLQGYLMVYSATDPFDDGDVLYYAHSSYAIYTTDGKLFKNVENHISRSDEIPDTVTLPVGSYLIEARSEKDGYVRVHVGINAGRQTVVDLDSRS